MVWLFLLAGSPVHTLRSITIASYALPYCGSRPFVANCERCDPCPIISLQGTIASSSQQCRATESPSKCESAPPLSAGWGLV